MSLVCCFVKGVDSSGLHVFKFSDAVLTLSDSRLLLLAHKLNMLEDTIAETAAAVNERAELHRLRLMVPDIIGGAAPPDACTWNLLLRRR